MRSLVPLASMLLCLGVGADAFAQAEVDQPTEAPLADGEPTDDASGAAATPAGEATPPPAETSPETAPPDPQPPVETARANDRETAAEEPAEEAEDPPSPWRLFISLQLNTQIGSFDASGTSTGDIPIERATVVGVPTAIIGARYDWLTFGLGAVWTQVSSGTMQTNFCTGMVEEYRTTQTIWGLLPTVRADFLRTNDRKGALTAGLTLPILVGSGSTDMATGTCMETPPGHVQVDVADVVYGFDLLLGGRYHVWPALSLGIEAGFAYLVYDFDDDPTTPYDEPSSRFFTLYGGFVVAVDLTI